MFIEVIHRTRGYVTREATEDQYDADDIEYSTSISGIRIVEKAGYKDLAVSFDVKENHPYHLVYVAYSTGDSFHRESGRVEFCALFEEETSADMLADDIRKNKENSLVYLDEAGREITLYCGSWIGYFESLDSVRVETVYLEK